MIGQEEAIEEENAAWMYFLENVPQMRLSTPYQRRKTQIFQYLMPSIRTLSA
jgi:hypothetical protein